MTVPPDVLVFRFPLPDEALSPNGRAPWGKKHRLKSELWDQCDLLAAGNVNPSAPATPWATAQMTVRLVVWNALDNDNASARLKPLRDWLKQRGYIANDSARHLIEDGYPVQRVSRKNSPSVEITLTRVDG
jgi:hypothetical protein